MPTTITITTYGLNEAAKLLGVSRWTIHRAITEGKLPAHRSKGRVVIAAADLLDYVLAHRGGAGIPQA